MKLSTSLLLGIVTSVLAVAVSVTEGRMLIGLAELWGIEKPETTFVPLTNTFNMEYGVSSDMTSANTRAEIFTEGCQNPTIGNAIPITDGIESQSITISGTTSTLQFDLDTSVLANNDMVYNTDSGIDYTGKGVMKLCVRYMLWSGPELDPNAIEVNYLESILTVTLDLTDGFQVDSFSVVRKDTSTDFGNENEREAYEVDAYFCDATTFQQTYPKAFSQGSLITICVQIEEQAISDGIYLKSIDTFTWRRVFSLDAQTHVTQIAIENSVAGSNGLTVINCVPVSAICSFRSILISDFYVSAGTVTGSGTISMMFGPLGTRTRTRNLAETTNVRALQENEDRPASSDFDISIGVLNLDDGPDPLRAGGASPIVTIAATTTLVIFIIGASVVSTILLQ